MKIAVIDTGLDGVPLGEARAFLPELLKGLAARSHEIHLITKRAADAPGFENVNLHADLWKTDDFVEETAPVLARWLNDLNPDIYLIWASGDIAWVALPMLDPSIAALTIGHADSDIFYLPAGHYRSFLSRLIGTSPEVCIGYVLSSVIEKERVEWISYREEDGADEEPFDVEKVIKHFESCFEKAVADAHAAPREKYNDYPLPPAFRSRLPVWLRRLKAKMMN